MMRVCWTALGVLALGVLALGAGREGRDEVTLSPSYEGDLEAVNCEWHEQLAPGPSPTDEPGSPRPRPKRLELSDKELSNSELEVSTPLNSTVAPETEGSQPSSVSHDGHEVITLPLAPVADAARQFVGSGRLGLGKNSFLTGFGLGFLAFGLKKLLLPVFIGMQIVKSVLIAMFLPTILSHVGKLVGKGVSSVAAGSSSPHHDQMADFEFKDDTDQEGAGSETWAVPSQSHATLAALNPQLTAVHTLPANQHFADRLTAKLPPLTTKHTGSFYSKDAQQDYKVFQRMPGSSGLLAHYDPFYSPLLSRLDAVFAQLGTTAEPCRQRLVCDMYRTPAKFAPHSNLVSAQLSRELNELRKPSSDNPEILRFFRYMKAAKDGQDGLACDTIYSACVAPTAPTRGSPMVETFNQINKLVHARKLRRRRNAARRS